MTATIELTPEEEALLRQSAPGQAPDRAVHSLVRLGLFAPTPGTPDPATVSDEAHEALLQKLLDAGLMTARPARLLGPPPPPIPVRGRPVSETILEERR